MASSATNKIRPQSFTLVRDEIISEIHSIAGQDYNVRLQYASDTVARMASSADNPLDRLRVVYWTLHSLFNAARVGGMSLQQIATLRRIAEIHLRIIEPMGGREQMAGLRQDLALASSQVYRKFGLSWDSAWELTKLRRTPTNGKIPSRIHDLGMARQHLRLGLSGSAAAICEDLMDTELEAEHALQVRIVYVQILRLTGKPRAALAEIAEIENESVIKGLLSEKSFQHFRIEWQWQKFCAQHQIEPQMLDLVRTVGSGMPHCQASYIVEAFLRFQADPIKLGKSKLRKMRGLIKETELGAAKLGGFYHSAVALENAIDEDLSDNARIDYIGEAVTEAQKFMNIEHELLVLVAAARLLDSLRYFDAGRLIRSRYEGLCRSLSAGQSVDTLFGVTNADVL